MYKTITLLLMGLLAPQMLRAEINIPLRDGVEPPALLSQTGIFKNPVTALQATDGFLPYEINQALWVDFAQKQRWIYIPAGKQIQFSATEPYGFPVGTILVKHFQMEISKAVFQNIETRVLVKTEGENWIGYTYQWNGSDAALVAPKASPTVNLQIDSSALGGARTQAFKIPSRNQCLQCHNASVGFVRSVRTQQLNRASGGENQLEAWNQRKAFDHDIGSVLQYGAYANINNQMIPAQERVKSYLSVNCSHCHNPDPKAMCNFTGLDFRFETFKAENLIASGHIVPGAKQSSELFKRMASTTPFERMPYIGSVVRDESALEVVGKWIDNLLTEGK